MKIQSDICTLNMEECFTQSDIQAYRLKGVDFLNDYFVVSSSDTRRLLSSPEIIGYEVCECMLPATSAMLEYLKSTSNLENCTILNILRGALNFPIEQACYAQSVPVKNIDFLSCERAFDKSGIPNGLRVKYDQVYPVHNATLILGDIIASGDTLRYCLNKVTEYYRHTSYMINHLIVFTIGGTKAIALAENLTKEIREYWPGFKGITLVFYEGVFSCYEPRDTGVSGINSSY